MFIDGVFTSTPELWIDFGISAAIIIALSIVSARLLKRVAARIFLGFAAVLVLGSWFFGLTLLHGISLAIAVSGLTAFVVINQADARPFVSNALKSSTHKQGAEKVFDRHELYTKIATTVEQLSKNKVGAIMTFEKNVKLTDVIKSGTLVNAPVTPELLSTIFYPGTRLHDGAVVIRRDQILAASVYYTPTTKPLTGKFGSRHRAAIGISEVTDSVTVVVSEETGRVSLAVDGELIHVTLDNFLRSFEDYMLQESTNQELL